MTQSLEIYRCGICGNIVRVMHNGRGVLVCCGQPMNRLVEKTGEHGLTQRHLPVIRKAGPGIHVQIGSISHPMEETHAIEWIEVQEGDQTIVKMLRLNELPEGEFPCTGENVKVRAYCNLHGLWTNRP